MASEERVKNHENIDDGTRHQKRKDLHVVSWDEVAQDIYNVVRSEGPKSDAFNFGKQVFSRRGNPDAAKVGQVIAFAIRVAGRRSDNTAPSGRPLACIRVEIGAQDRELTAQPLVPDGAIAQALDAVTVVAAHIIRTCCRSLVLAASARAVLLFAVNRGR